MSKKDDRLEEKIKVMEEGVEPETVIGGSSNSSELKSLVNLVASIRDLPHPELDRQTIQSDKRRLISAAREKNRTSRNSKATKSNGFTGLWIFVPAVAGVALILLMAFVLSAGAGLYFSGPRGAQAAVLTDGIGVLEVSDSGVSGDWRPVSNGDSVSSGQRLRTGDESWVTLEFFDGTRTTLAPNTDLVLYKIDGDWGNELQVELIQNEGETNHQVVPLQGDQANYQVFTPSGEARVRGTSFSVLVEETGVSLFTVETGEVLVSNDGFETFVSAGQSVVTELGVAMDAPSDQFSLQGPLGPKSGNTRSVAGVAFTVRGWTLVVGNPKEGDFVEVEGRINKKGEWVADRITRLGASVLPEGTLTGVVTSKESDSFLIGRYSFNIVGPIPDVAVGDLVRVTFTIDGEVWTVVTLEILDGVRETDQDDDPDDADNDQYLEPELYFNPEEIEVPVPACEVGSEFITQLVYDTNENVTEAVEVDLVADIVNGKNLVEQVTFTLSSDPDNPVTVEPADFPVEFTVNLSPRSSIEISVTIELVGGSDKLDPGNILEFQLTAEGDIEGEIFSENFEIYWNCEEDVTDEPIVKEGHYCTSAELHPKAQKLSDWYNENKDLYIPPQTIEDWFCKDNLGFGEIEQAFKLYLKYELDDFPLLEVETVDDIIDMRLDGMGWGQVKHEMARLAKEALLDELSVEETKKEPPGKQKSEEAKNKKEKPNKKDKDDD